MHAPQLLRQVLVHVHLGGVEVVAPVVAVLEVQEPSGLRVPIVHEPEESLALQRPLELRAHVDERLHLWHQLLELDGLVLMEVGRDRERHEIFLYGFRYSFLDAVVQCRADDQRVRRVVPIRQGLQLVQIVQLESVRATHPGLHPAEAHPHRIPSISAWKDPKSSGLSTTPIPPELRMLSSSNS